MAKFDIDGLSQLVMDLNELASFPDDTIKDMLKAETDVIAPAQEKHAKSMGVYDTGQLVRSITVKTPKKYKDGSWRSYIIFKGSRMRGKTKITNSEIAFINEFGRKNQRARPFIKTANESSVESAVSAAEDVYDKFLKKYNL